MIDIKPGAAVKLMEMRADLAPHREHDPEWRRSAIVSHVAQHQGEHISSEDFQKVAEYSKAGSAAITIKKMVDERVLIREKTLGMGKGKKWKYWLGNTSRIGAKPSIAVVTTPPVAPTTTSFSVTEIDKKVWEFLKRQDGFVEWSPETMGNRTQALLSFLAFLESSEGKDGKTQQD